jgi:hypothetical protein
MKTTELSIEDRRLALRQQMWERRKNVMEKTQTHQERSSFPRSSIMRVLSKEQGQKMVLALATGLIAGSKVKLISTIAFTALGAYFLTRSKE